MTRGEGQSGLGVLPRRTMDNSGSRVHGTSGEVARVEESDTAIVSESSHAEENLPRPMRESSFGVFKSPLDFSPRTSTKNSQQFPHELLPIRRGKPNS